MIIDLRTLAFVAGIANFLQVIAVYLQFRVNKKMPGVGLWLAGFSLIACGFMLFILRDFISIKLFSIILPNALQISGMIFLYVGVVRFLGGREQPRLIVAFLLTFFLCFFYYTFGQDDINIRTMLVSAGFAFFSFLIAYSFFMNRYEAIAVSANFNAGLMAIYGFVALLRAVEVQTNPQSVSMFDPSLVQIIFFLASFVEGLLFAFGLVAMINQLSNAEAVEAKKQFEMIFNTSPDAVLITRLHDGFFDGINEGFLKLTGYAREELTGKSTLDVDIWSNPADRQKIVDNLQEKGYCENLEGIFKTKNGSQRTGLISARLTDLHGQPHIISVTRDITERKIWEESLRESEEKWRSLVSASPDYIALLDCQGRYLFLNHYAEGFTESQVIGTSLFEYLSPESTKLYRGEMEECLNTLTPRKFEYNAMGNYGTVRTYEQYLVPIINAKKEIELLAIARDITERKQADDALRKSKAQYDRLVSKIPVGVYIVRSNRDRRFGFDYVSPRMAEMIDMTVEELMTNPVSALPKIHPDDLGLLGKLNLEADEQFSSFEWNGRFLVKGRSGGCRSYHRLNCRKMGTCYGTVLRLTSQIVYELKRKFAS